MTLNVYRDKRSPVGLGRLFYKIHKSQCQARMGATLNPFAIPEAHQSIKGLQVWTGLKEDFLNIVPNAALDDLRKTAP